MLSNTQLLEQLSLQHKMNATVNPDWVRADYNWTRAIMVEAVEALDHLGWKWWKALPTADQSQFRMELVDVWHFVLSNELAYTEGRPARSRSKPARCRTDAQLRHHSGAQGCGPARAGCP